MEKSKININLDISKNRLRSFRFNQSNFNILSKAKAECCLGDNSLIF